MIAGNRITTVYLQPRVDTRTTVKQTYQKEMPSKEYIHNHGYGEFSHLIRINTHSTKPALDTHAF